MPLFTILVWSSLTCKQLLSLVTIGFCIWVLVDSPSFADFLDVIDADVPIYRTGQ